MMTLSPATADLIAGALGFLFTVALLSYLIGDNPLYRIALHIFIGVSVGYAALVVVYEVLIPRLVEPLRSGDMTAAALAAMPLALFLFLVLKISPKAAPLGNLSTAYLLGVGTAVAVGGALAGTLVPQVQATWLSILPGAQGGFLNNLILIAGVVCTLAYFQFWVRGRSDDGQPRRGPLMRWLAGAGQAFIVVALGTAYAGMILSGIAVLSERLTGLSEWITTVIR